MAAASPKRQLSLVDSTCIIVGIIIGAGIYETTPLIARNVSGPLMLLGVFALGGLISLVGATCYAELTTAYPREGGDYVFLTRAYGRRMGFLFAWSDFWIVRPSNIGFMAYVFARYASQLWPLPAAGAGLVPYAIAAVLLLFGANLLGVQTGKWTQNVLTTVKVVGLLAVVAVGLWLAMRHVVPAAEIKDAEGGGIRLAMIFVLFAYGGWNEMSYVAAEVRDPQRNLLRALLLGTAAVTTIYLLVNLSFLGALGFQGIRDSSALASDVVAKVFGHAGRIAISILICISCLGAINGSIFTGSRVYYALGTEHRLYAWLGRWNERAQAPLRSLVIQALATLVLVVLFGTGTRTFDQLVVFSAPFFWFFFALVGFSLLILRWKDRGLTRTYRTPAFPFIWPIFLAAIGFMLYSAATYAFGRLRAQEGPWYGHFESLWPAAIMLVGLAASMFDPPLGERGASAP